MATSPHLKEMLLAVTEGCLAMQADHLACLATGNLAKINQWIEERQVMVARLRQAFSEAMAMGLDPDLRDLLRDRVERLMEGEARLFAAAEQRRGSLGDSLNALRRGRRALTGYGPSANRGPRFVSDQG